jgi:purine nucleosidase
VIRSFKALLVCTLGFIATSLALAKTPVILSTDIGNEIDDQWAIAYMMLDPDFDVLGVISAHAPSIPDPAGYNSYLLLRDEIENRLSMRVHPPILAGADIALVDARTPRMNDAVRFLIEESKGYSANHRLTIIGIGAATDIASAILADPSIADRIRVVSMAFNNENNAKEYNVQNDVPAWQVLLSSGVPLVIGPGDVCRRDLAMHYDQAKTMLAPDGAIGQWLWDEYNAWYYRQVKPLRKDDFAKPWMIWDIITMAYLKGMTEEEVQPRPMLGDNLTLSHPDGREKIIWITGVDSTRLWADFQKSIKTYLSTHATPTRP